MKVIPIDGPAQVLLDPDIVWNGAFGDLALTAADDPVNPAGLRATAALETAVIICLMTDRRVEPSELRDGDVNKGWPGDGFDLEPGERPLGSRLWLLRRSAMSPDIEARATDYAREALQTLVEQKAFARVEVSAEADRPQNRLDLTVRLYGRDGAITYDRRFAVLWESV